jgi:plastocyanin
MLRRILTAFTLAPFVLLLAAVVAPVSLQAGGGCHGRTTAPPRDDAATVVKMDGCMYYPTVARVPIGATVTFINIGQLVHNVTGVGGMWESGELANGARYQHGFSEAGVYPFACTLHAGMNGAIVVGDEVAAAGAVTTDAEGSSGAGSAVTAVETPPTDWMLLGAGALAGLGAGAIVGVLATGILAGRRRRPAAAPERVAS